MAATKQTGKHKFNVVDAVILAAVVIVIAAAVLILGSKGILTKESDALGIEYVIEFRQIRDEYVGNFKVGDKLIDASAKYQLGEVIAVNSSVAVFTGTNTVDGSLVYYDYPEHSTVALTVRSTAVLNDEKMYIVDGGYRISVGSTMYIRMPGYTGVAYCTRMKITEAK